VSNFDAGRTLRLGPENILTSARVPFRDELSALAIGEAVERVERAIRGRHPEWLRIYITPTRRS
jgi:hypothetical protein